MKKKKYTNDVNFYWRDITIILYDKEERLMRKSSCCIERASVSFDMKTNNGMEWCDIHNVRGSLVLVVLGMAQVDVCG
jgi:hypothetical protein